MVQQKKKKMTQFDSFLKKFQFIHPFSLVHLGTRYVFCYLTATLFFPGLFCSIFLYNIHRRLFYLQFSPLPVLCVDFLSQDIQGSIGSKFSPRFYVHFISSTSTSGFKCLHQHEPFVVSSLGLASMRPPLYPYPHIHFYTTSTILVSIKPIRIINQFNHLQSSSYRSSLMHRGRSFCFLFTYLAFCPTR